MYCKVYHVIQRKTLIMQFILRVPWISITFFLSCCKKKKMERLSNRNKLNRPKIITGTVCCINGFPPGASGSLHEKRI
jgi:hypothetical protein